MNLPITVAILTSFVFGILAIYVSLKKDKAKVSQDNLIKLKENFTHVIVHELRAPLTAIKDAAEVMVSGDYELDKEEEKQFLEIIHKQAKLLLAQISSILDSAKLEDGKFIITKASGDIAAVISQQVEMFQMSARKKNISINLNIPSSLPQISFDQTRIGQAINNLLSNSLKFTPGNGKIEVSAKYTPSDKYVTVAVSDTGIGIPKDFQTNLFAKFSQARTTPKELAKAGTGLGLYFVKGVIDAHGGTVSVESEEGKGTTISFTLPA